MRALTCDSVIRHLERLGDECPKALIATHFHEIYSLGFVSESEIVSFWVRRGMRSHNQFNKCAQRAHHALDLCCLHHRH